MKSAFAILALLTLAACVKQEEGVAVTTNGNFRLERLFSYDGCTVYRFHDDRTVYYTDCRGETSWRYTCGKNCTRDQNVESSGR